MKRSDSIRVGFAISPREWLGGRNYQRNLFAAMRALPGLPIQPVLFAGMRDQELSKDFPETEIIRTPILDQKSPSWYVRKVIWKLASQDMLVSRLLRRNRIDVVSHSYLYDFHPGQKSGIRTIGWIADFQHMHMPDFFGAEICRQIDRNFQSTCENCDLVILSSDCARVDMRTFAPTHADKAELLRFIASPAQTPEVPTLLELQGIYGFDAQFFLLPNQFWVHKNHRVVIDALQLLKQGGRPHIVLATGSTEDYRDPSFFPKLMQHAAECDVLDSFRVLGKIPYDHLVGLMRHAVAFLNPSFFEGWSTSVEEAKSMGKQIVLSELPVHREQAPERGFYFSPSDPHALAAAMIAAGAQFDARVDEDMQRAALAKFPDRLKAFGEAYRRIVERALGTEVVRAE